MTLTCKIRIDAIEQLDNPFEEPIHTKVSFTMMTGFETPRYIMPQIRNAVSQAEAGACCIRYDTNARIGSYLVFEPEASVSVGQLIELPISTYLHPPKKAGEIVAALERDPANLVINFYSGNGFKTAWIEREDKEDTSPHCEVIDQSIVPEIGQLLADGLLAFDQSGNLRLASAVQKPMSRAAYEKEFRMDPLEVLGWVA